MPPFKAKSPLRLIFLTTPHYETPKALKMPPLKAKSPLRLIFLTTPHYETPKALKMPPLKAKSPQHSLNYYFFSFF